MLQYDLAGKDLRRLEAYKHISSQESQRIPEGFDEKRLIRRIDRRILPLLCIVYFVQFLDKLVLNYANIMGIQKDLHMKSNDYSWAATAFSLGYMFAEFPQGAFLQYFPVTKVLGINICLWGIVLACTGAVQTSTQLIAMRTLLGVFEAVVTPALIMITAAWYKRQEGVYRLGIWFCGLGAGQIVSGLVCFGAQHYTNMSFQGWRLVFLCIGALNLVVAPFVYLLPSSPEDACFLSAVDKEFTLKRLKEDHSGVGIKIFRLRSVLEVFLDLQTWLLCLITLLTTLTSGVIVFYSAALIKSLQFGGGVEADSLLTIPCGVVGIIALFSVSYAVKHGFHRWLFIAISCVPTLLGACLMAFLPSHQKAGSLAGVYLINTAPAVYALVLSTAVVNYRGYTRKLAGSAMIAASFSIANILGPQTFQAKNAPSYLPAKITIIGAMSLSIFLTIGLRVLYGHRNRMADRRDEPAMSRYERGAILARGKSVEFAERGWRYSY